MQYPNQPATSLATRLAHRLASGLVSGILGVMFLVLTPLVHASHLPPPAGPVLLTVTGNLEHPNTDDEVHLDLASLQSLPVTEFTTSTPWHDSAQSFTGVRLNDLLAAIGSAATEIVAVGLDDYRFTISDIDFDKYPIMIAYHENGNTISVRSLGPLRIIMPYDDFPDLQSPLNESRSVWQLVKLELR